MKMNDKFKAKVKMFMLKAALTASVSAGVTGVAAQNVQNNDKNSDSVEQGINSRRVECLFLLFSVKNPLIYLETSSGKW